MKVYVQGRERNTRSGLAALDSKCWIMVTVCPTTRLVNMQVIERSLADGIISGVTRLSCEIGVPKKLFIDQDRARICGLENVEFEMRRRTSWRGSTESTSRCALSRATINTATWRGSSAAGRSHSTTAAC